MNNEKLYTVYKHTNIKNGKIYIGITSKEPEARWQNGRGYRPQRLFWRAIQKYGWDNFKHEILFKNLSKEEAFKEEIFLIKKYKSNDRHFGYNVSSGGKYGATGIKCSEETRKKLSESHKGKTHTEETKKKIGMNSWTKRNKGNFSFSEEHKQKLIKANQKYAKRIICLETGEVFNSICEASRKLNIHKATISKVCLNQRKSTGGLTFKYYINGDNI